MQDDSVDFDDPSDILRWLLWSGQLVVTNGKLRLWRQYKGSIYPPKIVAATYAVARSAGAEVLD